MQRLLALAMLVLVAVLYGPVVHAGPLQDLALRAKPSVVLLTIYDAAGQKIGSGTGFFVGADGRIVTNHHVIDGAAKVVASLADGTKTDVLGIVADDPEKDLAVIKLPGPGYPSLTLGESKGLRMGDEVVVIGSPLGLSSTLSVGIVSAIRSSKDLLDPDDPHSKEARVGSWAIQVTAAISPGSSGSPIMTTSGEVVAVAVGRLVGGESLNFGIAIEDAKALLEKAGPDAKPTPFAAQGNSQVRRNLVISAGFFLFIAIAWFGWRRWDERRARRAKAATQLRH